MKNKFKVILSALTVGAFAFALSGRASADEILNITDGAGASVIIDVNTTNWTDTVTQVGVFTLGTVNITPNGVISYDGSVGLTWVVNVTTATSYPTEGTQTAPKMNLNSQDISNATGDNLSILFSDTGYSVPGSAGVGSTATVNGLGDGGSVDLQTLLNGSTVTDATLDTLGSISTSGPIPGLVSTDVLAEQISITDTSAGEDDTALALSVPDGGTTVALLGLSLVGLAGVGAMRRKLAAA